MNNHTDDHPVNPASGIPLMAVNVVTLSNADTDTSRTVFQELRSWQPRRWFIALATTLGTILFIAIPTVLIPNPWFTREIPPTDWAWPVLIITSVLAGMLTATYVARKDRNENTRSGVLGTTGALFSFFAVGCPVCNKLVLLAIGYTGALQFFEPLQPYLAAGSIILLAVALFMRITKERSCPLQSSQLVKESL